jgi:hypothetical protein
MRKQLYSELGNMRHEQPLKQSGQKRTQKLPGSQRKQLSATWLILKQLKWPPKCESKPAIAPQKLH